MPNPAYLPIQTDNGEENVFGKRSCLSIPSGIRGIYILSVSVSQFQGQIFLHHEVSGVNIVLFIFSFGPYFSLNVFFGSLFPSFRGRYSTNLASGQILFHVFPPYLLASEVNILNVFFGSLFPSFRGRYSLMFFRARYSLSEFFFLFYSFRARYLSLSFSFQFPVSGLVILSLYSLYHSF